MRIGRGGTAEVAAGEGFSADETDWLLAVVGVMVFRGGWRNVDEVRTNFSTQAQGLSPPGFGNTNHALVGCARSPQTVCVMRISFMARFSFSPTAIQ
jgi:hypothetical protein